MRRRGAAARNARRMEWMFTRECYRDFDLERNARARMYAVYAPTAAVAYARRA